MSTSIDYDFLFAYRYSLQEEEGYENEEQIINLLSTELQKMGIPEEEVGTHLKTFYEKFNINFPLENINQILHRGQIRYELMRISDLIEQNNLTVPALIPILGSLAPDLPDLIPAHFNQTANDDDDDYSNMPPLIPITLLNYLNNIPEPVFGSVVSTLKEEEFSKINKYSIIKNLDENCAICLVNMEAKQEIWELECNHKFHGECLETLLKNYNYTCPICRKEVGEAKHNF